MNFLKTIVKISRPRFWLYLAGAYLFGYTIAYTHTTVFLTPLSVGLFLFFLIPANSFMYGVNDLFDQETDKFNNKKITFEEKVTSQNNRLYKTVIFISFGSTIPFFFLLHGISQLLFITFILISFFYSAPPLRFKTKPFIDSLSNVLYALPGFIGYTQLTGALPPSNILFIAVCWTAAMHLYSAIPDIEADQKAGLTTTAIYLGYDKSLQLCFILWLIVAIIATSYSSFLIMLFIYPIAIALVLFKKISVDTLYWKFPFINTIIGFFLYVYAYNI